MIKVGQLFFGEREKLNPNYGQWIEHWKIIPSIATTFTLFALSI